MWLVRFPGQDRGVVGVVAVVAVVVPICQKMMGCVRVPDASLGDCNVQRLTGRPTENVLQLLWRSSSSKSRPSCFLRT